MSTSGERLNTQLKNLCDALARRFAEEVRSSRARVDRRLEDAIDDVHRRISMMESDLVKSVRKQLADQRRKMLAAPAQARRQAQVQRRGAAISAVPVSEGYPAGVGRP